MALSRRGSYGLVSRALVVCAAGLFAVLCAGEARGQSAAVRASELMEKRLFRDAADVLEAALKAQGDGEAGTELRLLGECHFMMRDYGAARTAYLRALPRQTSLKGTIVCEARLAFLDYRLGDTRSAEERIENFLRKYPADERVGGLAVIRIRIIQAAKVPIAEKIRRIEAEYEKIAGDKERFGYYNAVLAAQALGDLYTDSGSEQKAIALYVTAVHEMRGLITTLKAAGRSLPADLLQGVDGMSLQVAKYHLAKRDWNEAQKWLENVTYSDEMIWQAKYALAQIAYQKRDHGFVLFHLPDELMARVPEGETKWGMYLLLGLSTRDAAMPDPEKAKEYLKKIPPQFHSYLQAQHALADIYREQRDYERAETHYAESVKDPRYAPAALFALGQIAKERADAMKPKSEAEKKQREALLEKAGDHFRELLSKYPLTDVAKQAKPLVDALREQGIVIETEASEGEKIGAWEKVAREKPGSNEAAQALISLARHHARTVLDPKTKAVTKAPDWNACSEACLPLVRAAEPYANVSAERWRELRATALFLLARAELGSLPPGASTRRLSKTVEPVRIPAGGSAARALQHVGEAVRLTDAAKQPEFFRDMEFVQLEAMFKSDDAAIRERGECRYGELETKYGSDPEYQRLAVVMADWLDEHGFHEMAGRTYRAVARKATLDREQIMHLLHLAGLCYAKAGRAMLAQRDTSASLAFMAQPRGVIRTGAASVLKTHPPFQYVKRIVWEAQGPDPTALDALVRLSREFGVPFVWSPDASEGSVAAYLKQTTIPRAKLAAWREPRSLEVLLGQVVDLERFAVDFDLGATGATPTLQPRAGGDDAAGDEPAAIEIFDPRRERFPRLAVPYGAFAEVHSGPTMLFHIVKRVEDLTGARVVWGEGVQKDEALAREFREFPGVRPGEVLGCRQALECALESVGLQVKVVRRDRSREMLLESNDCFDELRKFGADSTYAEDAMFNIGLNLYVLKDYGKMKLLLREYLKTFDNPSFAHYYDACFWLGRLFEIDRNYREAVKYYTMASEERVVLFQPGTNAVIPTLADIRSRLSYETLFSLSRKASGVFKDAPLDGAFLSFIRFHTNVDIALDPSARSVATPVNRDVFAGVPCIELLHDALVALGLDLRTENGDKDVAERAYYRLALVYKEDNLLAEALENVQTLLARFPGSPRRVDALKLKLDIYKGLRDYGRVLATLDELRAAAAGKIEPHVLDYETGRVYFDLCDYTNAVARYARALSGAREAGDQLKIREAMAQSLMRIEGRWTEALEAYRAIAQAETSPLRQSVNAALIHLLEYASAAPPRRRAPLPAQEAEFLRLYEGYTAAQRAEMTPNELARVTWIYYALGMEEQVGTNTVAALQYLNNAALSPDPFLAGEALYQVGRIHAAQGDHAKARDAFLQLLFVTKAVEPSVKSTYELAMSLKALGDFDGAMRRFDEVVLRYPLSPYAERVRQTPFYQERRPAAPVPPAVPVPAPSAGGGASSGGTSQP